MCVCVRACVCACVRACVCETMYCFMFSCSMFCTLVKLVALLVMPINNLNLWRPTFHRVRSHVHIGLANMQLPVDSFRSCRGYIGFTPSVRLSVRPSRIPCPLCWHFFLNLKLWLCLLLTWDLMWITSIGNHGAAGISQNAGVLVVQVVV